MGVDLVLSRVASEVVQAGDQQLLVLDYCPEEGVGQVI